MPIASLLLLIVLALALAILTLPQTRSFLAGQLSRLRSRGQPAPPRSVVIDEDGAETPVPEARPRRARRRTLSARLRMPRREELREMIRQQAWRDAVGANQRLLVSLLIILVALLVVWQQRGLLPSRLDRFTVLVAPFNERDGSVSQTGREVASQLVRSLGAVGGVRVQAIEAPPADLNAAFDRMRAEGADVLIWGTINPGGMLNQESLIPTIAYRPNGAFAPLAWQGYSGRFAMPEFYQLADAPINGQVVLPELFRALSDYSAGRVDAAFNTLGTLVQNTPALIATLPHSIRGNILWARGDYGPAINEYLQALTQTARQSSRPAPDPRALLSNNLGAIQQDAGDTAAAAAAFAQSIKALGGRDLGELRYNLGIGYLHDGKYGDAATSIEIARKLLPPSAPMLLDLSEAYRMDGRLPQARAALNAAQQQIALDTQATTSDLRGLLGSQLRGAAAQQRGLVSLTERLQARGPLLWELQASDAQDLQALNDARADLAQAVDETNTLAQTWNRRSAAEDAAEHQIGGLLAIQQYVRATALLAERRLWNDALGVEIARVQGVQPPSGLSALWARLLGNRSALGQARNDLADLVGAPPNSADEAFTYGQALLLTEGPARAAETFDKAAADYPASPEPPYGQALAAEARNDDERAIDFLTRSIRLDERYFPARLKLAELAEATQKWPIAVDQRGWLAQQRPGADQTLKLAAALRHTGPDNYAEAERLLLGLVNDTRAEERDKVPALTELGRLYYDTQDWQAARTVLERAQRAAPRDPAVAYEMGRVLAKQGDTAAAATQFQLAIANDPQPVQAHLALADFYVEQANSFSEQNAADQASNQDRVKHFADNMNAAEDQYRAALAAGPTRPQDLTLIGEQLLGAGDYASAASAYEQLNKILPNDPAVQHGLARSYLGQGRLDAAQAAEQRALTLTNNAYPEALAGMGDIMLRRGRPEDAIRQYNAALQQDTNLTSAYIGLGRVSFEAGNWAVAAGHFQQAISQANGSAEAHYWLGQALFQQRDYNGAISEYRQAVGIRPDYAEAYYGLARAQLATSQTAAATASLTATLTIRPSYAEAWLERGKLYEQLGHDGDALAAYNQAITSNAKLAEARYRRGLLYTRQDRMGDAETDLAAATSAQPNFPEAHYWLGRVYLAQNRPAAARDELKTAIGQRGGSYPDARFYQGLAEEQLGQRDAATASYEAALAQSGDSAWASDARAALARLGQP